MKKYPEGEEDKKDRVEEPDLSGTYNAADYLSWEFEGLFEIIRGKVFRMSPPGPSINHQDLSGKLVEIMRPFFIHKKCKTFNAPTDVYLGKGKDLKNTWNVVQPDFFVVCDLNKLHQSGCFGPPDFIIEILSPSTKNKDLTLKFDLYQEFKVPEYWIVDLKKKKIWRNILTEAGKFERIKENKPGDVISPAAFPDLEISLEELFKDIGI